MCFCVDRLLHFPHGMLSMVQRLWRVVSRPWWQSRHIKCSWCAAHAAASSPLSSSSSPSHRQHLFGRLLRRLVAPMKEDAEDQVVLVIVLNSEKGSISVELGALPWKKLRFGVMTCLCGLSLGLGVLLLYKLVSKACNRSRLVRRKSGRSASSTAAASATGPSISVMVSRDREATESFPDPSARKLPPPCKARRLSSVDSELTDTEGNCLLLLPHNPSAETEEAWSPDCLDGVAEFFQNCQSDKNHNCSASHRVNLNVSTTSHNKSPFGVKVAFKKDVAAACKSSFGENHENNGADPFIHDNCLTTLQEATSSHLLKPQKNACFKSQRFFNPKNGLWSLPTSAQSSPKVHKLSGGRSHSTLTAMEESSGSGWPEMDQQAWDHWGLDHLLVEQLSNYDQIDDQLSSLHSDLRQQLMDLEDCIEKMEHLQKEAALSESNLVRLSSICETVRTNQLTDSERLVEMEGNIQKLLQQNNIELKDEEMTAFDCDWFIRHIPEFSSSDIDAMEQTWLKHRRMNCAE